MSRSKKNRTEDEICVHHGRTGGVIFSIVVLFLLTGFVLILVSGKFEVYFILPILLFFICVLSWVIYHTWGDSMTVNDDGIHLYFQSHKNLNVSIPWEDVIEIYQEFSLRVNQTYVRFRNGPEIYREKENTEETYRAPFPVEDGKKMDKILAKHGFQIQLRAPKWMK